jgi:pentatricopeptide repeat protein
MTASGIRGDAVLYNTLINGCVYNRNPTAGVEVMSDATTNGIRLADDVYNNLLGFLVRGRRHQDSEQVLAMMRQMGSVPRNATEVMSTMVGNRSRNSRPKQNQHNRQMKFNKRS